MNKLKEYIKKKKVDNTFKHLGKGYVLSGDQSLSHSGPSGQSGRPSPSGASADARARAAAAVEKRWSENTNKMTAAQKAIYLQAKRELEEEQKLAVMQSNERVLSDESGQPVDSGVQQEDDSILYTCDLLDDLVLPKSEIRDAVESFLRSQLAEESVYSSVLMIHSLNKSSQITAAIEAIQKYLTNICNNPSESKFRKIRKTNKVFKEKIIPVKGAVEFLKAVGFVDMEIQDEKGCEAYLVMCEDAAKSPELLIALQELQNGSAVTIRLFRDPKIFSIDSRKPLPAPELSSDFYNLSTAELKQKYEEQRREVDRLTTLRTRKMREVDAGRNSATTYKRALVRVRFPNNYILQGLFNACEPTQAIREFIYEHLDYPEGEFVLQTAASSELSDKKTLMENGLAPSSIINFSWKNSTMLHFDNLQYPATYLKCDLERKAEVLNPL